MMLACLKLMVDILIPERGYLQAEITEKPAIIFEAVKIPRPSEVMERAYVRISRHDGRYCLREVSVVAFRAKIHANLAT